MTDSNDLKKPIESTVITPKGDNHMITHFWFDKVPEEASKKQVSSAKRFVKEWKAFFSGPVKEVQYKLTDDFLVVMIITDSVGCVNISKRGAWYSCQKIKSIKKAYQAEL